jgi:membrane protease YdiL (CAAX protease family)
MFQNRYWRSYPGWLQIVLFAMMAFSLFSFMQVVAFVLIPKITSTPVSALTHISASSSRADVNGFLVMQALMASGLFLIPSILFAYLTHPKPFGYLGLRKPGKAIHWLLVPVAMVALMPFVLWLGALFSKMDMGPVLKEMQEQNNRVMEALLKFDSSGDLVKALLVMAVLPAIAEELFFRGVIMRMIHWRMKRIVHVVVLSSLMFMLMHGNPQGMLSIFISGVVLALMYYWTGSLWLSMLAHLLNNGLQIALLYIGNTNAAVKSVIESNEMPISYVIVGLVVFAGSFYLLWKHRTPLPYDWSDDYAGEDGTELS